MRQKIKLTVSILTFILLVLSAPAGAIDDAIIAVVNDDVITFQDLNDYMHGLYMQLKAEGKADAEIEKILNDLQGKSINKLIEDKLVLQEADLKNVEVKPKIIDNKIKEVKKQYGDDKEFLDALLKNGLTISDLRKRVTDQFKIKFLIEDEVKSKIFVNPQEVTDYYNKNSSNFQTRESADLDSIFISKSKNPDSKEKAGKALEEIKMGKDFAQAVKEYSDSPSLGLIHKGEMLTAIDEAVFILNEGDISPVLEVDNGYYIFKVKKKSPAKESPIEDVKEKIRDKLFNEKFRDTYTAWIAKLKKKAFIEVKQ